MNFRDIRTMVIGPRSVVVATMLTMMGVLRPGEGDAFGADGEWTVLHPDCYEWQEWPELWMHEVRDFVIGDA